MDGSALKRTRDGGFVCDLPTLLPTAVSQQGGLRNDPRKELTDVVTELSRHLLPVLRQPTSLTLATVESPLGILVVAPRALEASDVESAVVQPWCDPFRLVRVVVRLPSEYVHLDSADLGVAIQSIIRNMTPEANLQTHSIPVTRANHREPPLLRRTLKSVVRASSADPCYGCVLIDIPVPTGITLYPGAAITLRLHVAGSPVTLRIPATGHIHSASCNHKRAPAGAVHRAAKAGDTHALEAALAEGGSTEEIDKVITCVGGDIVRRWESGG